jgi:enoyl-CoA hydratase
LTGHRADGAEPVVLVERRGEVALVTLNRPEVRNAIDLRLAGALCNAMAEVADSRVIVLTGRDPAFCAGLDLRSLGVERLHQLPRFVGSVAESPIPVVAAVNGPAVTGGLELALAADFIVASDRATFADTHARVGVYPGPVLIDLPRRVGEAKAREMSLTGNFVDSSTALRIGLANHVVAHSELLPLALRLAADIADQDPRLVMAMRRDWQASGGLPVEEARRVHLEHAEVGGFRTNASAQGLSSHREAVLRRSTAQRSGGQPE